MKCSQLVASTSYINTKPCIDGAYSVDTLPNFFQMKENSYAVQHGSGLKVGDIKDSCTITMIALAPDFWRWEGDQHNGSSPYKDLHSMMAEGFNLSVWEDAKTQFPVCFLGNQYGRMMCVPYFARKCLSM